MKLAPTILRRCVCPALLLAATAFSPISGEAAFQDDLVAYWPLDNSLEDSVGTHDGTMEGDDLTPSFASGKFGTGIDLDGALNQRVVIDGDENDFDFAGQSISVSAWFSVESFTKSWQALVAKGEGSGWRVARRGGSNVMSYAGGVGDIPSDDFTGPDVNDGALHHIVAISEAGVSTRLWVDGELVATGGPPNLEDRANPMMIGGNPDTGGDTYRTWDGVIDDVAIWNRVLSPAEIGAIWNGGSGAPIAGLLNPQDSDGDGMPNFWEEANDTNPNVNDAAEDPDGDTLTNLQEYNGGTNPQEKDTDKDGLDDNVETKTGVWVDAGNTGTSPTDADSDNDSLRDGVETNTGTFVSAQDTGTDPNKVDSDEDGHRDGVEVSAGTDPTDPNSRPRSPIFLGLGTQALLGGDLTDPEDDGDPESDFGYNAIFAASEEEGFGGGESAFNVFDNILGPGNDKWCCGDNDFPYWVQATFEDPIVLTHFTISSANDTPDRDPRVWQIQGSNDGENFETIFRQDNPTASIWGPDRLSVMRFNAGDHYPFPAAYTTIRFLCEATGLTSGARYQVGEIEFFGEPGTVALFEITSIEHNAQDDEFTLTWNSRPGATYSVFATTDLKIALEVDDGIPSGGDETSYTFPNPNPGIENQFFYVGENE